MGVVAGVFIFELAFEPTLRFPVFDLFFKRLGVAESDGDACSARVAFDLFGRECRFGSCLGEDAFGFMLVGVDNDFVHVAVFDRFLELVDGVERLGHGVVVQIKYSCEKCQQYSIHPVDVEFWHFRFDSCVVFFLFVHWAEVQSMSGISVMSPSLQSSSRL